MLRSDHPFVLLGFFNIVCLVNFWIPILAPFDISQVDWIAEWEMFVSVLSAIVRELSGLFFRFVWPELVEQWYFEIGLLMRLLTFFVIEVMWVMPLVILVFYLTALKIPFRLVE